MERECFDREQRKIDRLLKQSRLPLEKDIASFDLTRLPMKELQKLKAFLMANLLTKMKMILAFGIPEAENPSALCHSRELIKTVSGLFQQL